MMAMWSATKNVFSADLENVGQDHHLQQSYIGYYMTDFNQYFTKIIQLGLAAKASHQMNFKIYVKVAFHRAISAVIKSILRNVSSRIIQLPDLSRLCAGLHFFTLDNCLFYRDAPHKQVIYLRFTTLVSFVMQSPRLIMRRLINKIVSDRFNDHHYIPAYLL